MFAVLLALCLVLSLSAYMCSLECLMLKCVLGGGDILYAATLHTVANHVLLYCPDNRYKVL